MQLLVLHFSSCFHTPCHNAAITCNHKHLSTSIKKNSSSITSWQDQQGWVSRGSLPGCMTFWLGHTCSERGTPQCSALSLSSPWGSLTCLLGVMMKITALISPAALIYCCAALHAHACQGREQVNALQLHYHADRQSRNLVAALGRGGKSRCQLAQKFSLISF